MMTADRILRIANCSGFYGDRLSAAREMVEGGPIDVLTGDYLAELTMAILHRKRVKDETAGYAGTFLKQLREVIAPCLEQRTSRLLSMRAVSIRVGVQRPSRRCWKSLVSTRRLPGSRVTIFCRDWTRYRRKAKR